MIEIRNVARVSAATAAILVQVAGVYAAELTFTPKISLRTTIDDNTRLSVNNKKHTVSEELFVGSVLQIATPTSGLRLAPTLTFTRNLGGSAADLESDDQGLQVGVFRQQERSRVDVGAGLVRDTSRTSELEDSGRVQVNKRRVASTITPKWSYALSDATSISLRTSLVDVRFKDAANTGLTDYRSYEAQAGMSHQLDDRNEVAGFVTVARYEAADIGTEIDQVAGKAVYRHQFSETVRANLALGVHGSRTQSPSRNQGGVVHDVRPLADVGIEKKFERTRLRARYSRSLIPSSSGTLRNRDRIDLSMMRNLAPKLDGEVSFLVTDSDQADSGSGKVQYRQGLGRLSWRFARFWTLSGAYRHRQLERGNQAKAAVSNAVLVTLRYGEDKTVFSR